MLGTATKYFAGLAALALLAFLGYGFVEMFWAWAFDYDDADYRLLGTSLFFGLTVAAVLLAAIGLAAGDKPSRDRERRHAYPAVPSWWPLLTAAGVAILIVGLVADPIVTILGLLVVAFGAVEWVLSAWSEKLSTDAVANEQMRRTMERPFAVPLIGAGLVAGGVLLISRVLLAAATPNAATWIALAMMLVIVAAAFVLYALPGLRSTIVRAVVVLGVAAVIVGGVIGIASGTREFEEHHGSDEEHSEEEEEEGTVDESSEEGATGDRSAPVVIR